MTIISKKNYIELDDKLLKLIKEFFIGFCFLQDNELLVVASIDDIFIDYDSHGQPDYLKVTVGLSNGKLKHLSMGIYKTKVNKVQFSHNKDLKLSLCIPEWLKNSEWVVSF